jgi:hypothetical protein
MKRQNHKLSLLQPTRISIARAVGFSREIAGSFFDLYEEVLAGRD